MELKYTDKEYKEVEISDVNRIIVTDKDGNRYRIKADRFCGLEVMAEDGKISIEPNTSNLLTIKTVS
jgi:hypothetical protein